jgi:hypothetical protein
VAKRTRAPTAEDTASITSSRCTTLSTRRRRSACSGPCGRLVDQAAYGGLAEPARLREVLDDLREGVVEDRLALGTVGVGGAGARVGLVGALVLVDVQALDLHAELLERGLEVHRGRRQAVGGELAGGVDVDLLGGAGEVVVLEAVASR